MPRNRNKLFWEDQNPGFHGNNWQHAYQNNTNQNYYDSYVSPYFQNDIRQNDSKNNFNPNFRSDVGQNFNNNYFNPRNFSQNYSSHSFLRNHTQNRNNYSNFRGQSKKRHYVSTNDFNQHPYMKFPKVQKNIPQNTNSNELNVQSNIPPRPLNIDSNIQSNTSQSSFNSNNYMDVQRNIGQNINTNETTHKPIKPWYVNQKINGDPGENHYQKYGKPKVAYITRYDQKTRNYNEQGFIIKESLYQDPSLFYGDGEGKNVNQPDLCNEPNSNGEPIPTEDWTNTFWRKHINTGAPESSNTPCYARTVSRKNQNRVEKTLNKMLAKPAEMSKGRSLLEKMGWQGGGLGRDGDGIVEPIAPKATYAVNTIGLGHLTETPEPKVLKGKVFAQLTKKNLKRPEFQEKLYMNLLFYILEFVKNDTENKIVFEPRLCKLERKVIHILVEKLRESDDLDDLSGMENFNEKHLEVVKDIWVHNYYDLWTESEGSCKNRRLGIFKEAPAHVYMLTPENLREDYEKTDKVKKHGIHRNIKEENDLDNENQTFVNDEDDFDSDSVNIEEEKDNIIIGKGNVNNTETNSENENNTSEKVTTDYICIKKEQNVEEIKELKVKKEQTSHGVSFCVESKPTMEMYFETMKNVDVKLSDSILGKIVLYFKEFCDDDRFTEFRFLGPFNDGEIENINLFFNICLKLDENESAEKIELTKLFDENLLNVHEDNNGKRFIIKGGDSQQSPSSEADDVKFCDDTICLD
ncbi:probable WRKY transcription factor protein 1 isoform X1 [Pararge aegeria]|nr:probable WRKY transcription factor protein 1 isoform X1 [Pararge aegeria]